MNATFRHGLPAGWFFWMIRRASPAVVVILIVLAPVRDGRAADCTRTASGDWADATRWSCGVVPDADDHAIVAAHQVTVGAPASVGSLTISGAGVVANAPLEVLGTMTWTGGSVGGTATLSISSGATLVLTGPASKALGSVGAGTLVNNGAASWNEGGIVGSGVFVNNGTLSASVAGTFEPSLTVGTGGTLAKSGAGTLRFIRPFTANGTVQAGAGTLSLDGTFTLAGSTTVAGGAVLRLAANGTHSAGASIGGAGRLEIASGGQAITGIVTWTVGEVALSGGILAPNAASLTLSSALTWTGGTIGGTGGHAVILASGASLALPGSGTRSLSGRLESHTTVTWDGAGVFGGDGTFDNRGQLVVSGGTLEPPLLNSGVLRKTGPGTATLLRPFNNTGTTAVEAGTLVLNQGSYAGAIAVSPGALLRLAGGTLEPSLVLSGPGPIEMAGGFFGTVTVKAAYAPPGETRVVSGTVDFRPAASATFTALTQTGGTLDLRSPAITFTGPFTRTGGGLLATGGTITFAGSGLQSLDTSVATALGHVAVSPSTVLVEVQPAVSVTMSGTLSNAGVIRKVMPASPGAMAFGLTGVATTVTTLGTLGSIQVDRRDVTHPAATADQQTGRYWTITPAGAGYVMDVTLPHSLGAGHSAAAACRRDGSAWDCGRSTSSTSTVTRTGVTALSDWAVGTNGTPSYRISGTIRLGGTSPMGGVAVELSGAAVRAAVTDSAGAFSFEALGPGSYTVVPVLDGFAFDPEVRTIAALAGDVTANFTGVRLWTISGVVRDLNDTGLGGITVNVSGSATASTVTDEEGRYEIALPENGSYTLTPTLASFDFSPPSQSFSGLQGDAQATFFVAQVGAFTRYFAEGATGAFFDTRIALLNATGLPATATVKFLKPDGTVVPVPLTLAGLDRKTVDPETVPGLESTALATIVESTQPLIADRTMRWDDRGYGAHAETSIGRPLTRWYLAEGATIGGFNLFYLIQNPNPSAAAVRVRYLLSGGAAPIEKTYDVAANSRYNVWVNLEDQALASAEVSAEISSTNGVPIIVERAMYLDRGGRTFEAGHESAAAADLSTSWFLAEGATGDLFDLFILVANPDDRAAQLDVRYLLEDGTVIAKPYTVPGNSRFNIWVDLEDPRLHDAAVSTTLVSTNGVPVLVERAMWWPGDASRWSEGHNSAGAVQTGEKWGLADGEVGGPSGIETYVLIANTSTTAAEVEVRLIFEDGTAASRLLGVPPTSRTTVAVGSTFPEAAGRRFGTIVESRGAPAAQIVVERAVYNDAVIDGRLVAWAAGTNNLGTRLR